VRKTQWNPSLPQPKNGDEEHPAESPLWEDEYVLSCFRGSRPKVPDETKILKRRARNNRFWVKRNEERKRLEGELKPLLANGDITAEEYDNRLGKTTLGYYKHMHKAQVMSFKLAEVQSTLAAAGNDNAALVFGACLDFLREIRTAIHPPAQFDAVGNQLVEPARDATGQPLMDEDGRPLPLDAEEHLPLRSFPLPVWSQPSPTHYLHIVCLILPMSDWPSEDPISRRVHGHVVKILSASSTTYPAFDILGNRVTPDEKKAVLQTFNAAKGVIDRRAAEEVGFVESLKAEYQEVKEQVRNAILPVQSKLPVVGFMRLMEAVDEIIGGS
jgi:hypothetical protein